MSDSKFNGRKGRPIGYRLSEASKRAISEAKKGQKHKESTKDKISRTLQNYFRKKNPLSEEIINTYCRVSDDELCEWMCEFSEEIDSYRDILTRRMLNNKTQSEITYGDNIEELFSHSMTPELLLMWKQAVIDVIEDDADKYEGEIS